jgi:hypothetical protein
MASDRVPGARRGFGIRRAIRRSVRLMHPTPADALLAVGRGSLTPPLKGPEVSAVGVSPGLETSGLPEGGVVRPAPN